MPTFVGTQKHLSRTQRQAVAVADQGADDKFNRYVQILDHPANGESLLINFAAKIGPIGERDLKQLEDDRCYPPKMSRANRAVPRFGHIANFDESRKTHGINF